MEIVDVPLKQLKVDPANPRNNSGAVEKVADSIRDFGFRVPLVVNGDKMILAGHTRYFAAALLKMKVVPCVIAGDLTPEQQRAFNIADNRVHDFSFFDTAKLAELMTELDEVYVATYDLDALVAFDEDDEAWGATAPHSRLEKREGLDLAPFEKYQYLTVICRSTYDWTNLLARFGLEDVQRRYVGGVLKRGVSYGRIIEYADFVKAIENP